MYVCAPYAWLLPVGAKRDSGSPGPGITDVVTVISMLKTEPESSGRTASDLDTEPPFRRLFIILNEAPLLSFKSPSCFHLHFYDASV